MGIDLPASEGSSQPLQARPVALPKAARAKKPATDQNKAGVLQTSALAHPAAPVPEPVVSPSAKAPAKKGTKAAAAIKKAPKAKAAPRKVAVKPKKTKPAEITAELIAIRAFLVWENRAKQGIPGDETSDWIEAERQLRHELLAT